eukprot:gene33069-42780_t
MRQSYNQMRQIPPDFLTWNHNKGLTHGVHKTTHYPISQEIKPAVAASEARRFYDHLRNQTNLKT